jgi:NTP pyrophosphatase (non-canonical NTP hydrolase)
MRIEEEAKAYMDKNSMTFKEYQNFCKTTAIYRAEVSLLYPALGLTGEAGEVANKVKKLVRDGPEKLPADWKELIAAEIGDVLWYCSALASDLGIPLNTIAKQNIEKLQSRLERGVISGSGDKR